MIESKRIPLQKHGQALTGINMAKAMGSAIAKVMAKQNSEVTTTHGKAYPSGHDNVQKSHFSYKPRKGTKAHVSTYDCEHGVITKHFNGLRQSTPDRIDWHSLYETDFQTSAMNTYTNGFYWPKNVLDNGGTTIQQLTQVDKKLWKVEWVSREYVISNQQATGGWFSLYDLRLKKSGDKSNIKLPEVEMNDYFDEAVTQVAQYGRFGAGTVARYDDPDFKMGDNLNFLNYWAVDNVTKFYLAPGETHRHTTFWRMNFVYDYREVASLSVPSNASFAPLEHCLLVRYEGNIVQKKTNLSSIAEIGASYIYQGKQRFKISQLKPRGERFHAQLNEWVNRTTANTEYQAMQSEDHVDESMKT